MRMRAEHEVCDSLDSPREAKLLCRPDPLSSTWHTFSTRSPRTLSTHTTCCLAFTRPRFTAMDSTWLNSVSPAPVMGAASIGMSPACTIPFNFDGRFQQQQQQFSWAVPLQACVRVCTSIDQSITYVKVTHAAKHKPEQKAGRLSVLHSCSVHEAPKRIQDEGSKMMTTAKFWPWSR